MAKEHIMHFHARLSRTVCFVQKQLDYTVCVINGQVFCLAQSRFQTAFYIFCFAFTDFLSAAGARLRYAEFVKRFVCLLEVMLLRLPIYRRFDRPAPVF